MMKQHLPSLWSTFFSSAGTAQFFVSERKEGSEGEGDKETERIREREREREKESRRAREEQQKRKQIGR